MFVESSDEVGSEVDKDVLASRVRKYTKRGSILASNMNRIYGFIWLQFPPGIQPLLKGNNDYPTKFKTFNSLCLI